MITKRSPKDHQKINKKITKRSPKRSSKDHKKIRQIMKITKIRKIRKKYMYHKYLNEASKHLSGRVGWWVGGK